ncbi:MAG: hypothetical protein WD359_09425 [Dehalococcoidia bacterium]
MTLAAVAQAMVAATAPATALAVRNTAHTFVPGHHRGDLDMQEQVIGPAPDVTLKAIGHAASSPSTILAQRRSSSASRARHPTSRNTS